MNFLVPAFLAGLGALSIPVAIHLINRERKVVVEFPSLMFLNKIPYKSIRKQKLRHLLLLIMRCLALAVIVTAFSRPFFDKSKRPSVAGAGAREVVVALDHSYSMAYGTRFKRAQDAALEILGGLGPADHGTVVLFTTQAEQTTQPAADRGRLEAAIRNAKLTSEGTRYVPAIKLAAQILSASNLPRKELVFITDFQQSGWPKREEVNVPKDVTLKPVDVGSESSSDAAVISVTTTRDEDSTRAHVAVSARVTNVAARERETDAVLEIGGRNLESRHVTIPARGAATVAFSPVPVPGAATRGVVRIGQDSLTPDDRFNFAITPDEEISILIVQPPAARTNQSLFLRRALAVADHPKFHVDLRFQGDVKASDFDRRSLVIYNEAPLPTGTAGTRLRDLVIAGSGLIVVPGENGGDAFPAEWREFMPGTVGAVVDRSSDVNATIASVDYANPVFEIFSAPRSGDFAASRVYRYRTLKARGDSGIVARFDDGAPAMILRTQGTGRVALWATSLDAYWTDLPMQAGVYLPFVQQLAKRVGRYSDAKGWFIAGDALDLSRHAELTSALLGSGTKPASDSGELVLEAPSGDKTRLSVRGSNHLAVLKESGFYELRAPSASPGSGRPIAVNVDPTEADLSHLDPKELVAAATAPLTGVKTASAMDTGTPEEQERRQTIWWYLLLGALLLLAAETVMSNRLSRVASI